MWNKKVFIVFTIQRYSSLKKFHWKILWIDQKICKNKRISDIQFNNSNGICKLSKWITNPIINSTFMGLNLALKIEYRLELSKTT